MSVSGACAGSEDTLAQGDEASTALQRAAHDDILARVEGFIETACGFEWPGSTVQVAKKFVHLPDNTVLKCATALPPYCDQHVVR